MTRWPKKPKLLPCPFCGGKKVKLMLHTFDDGKMADYVQCTRSSCYAQGPIHMRTAASHVMDPAEAAAYGWNTRVGAVK